ncbi:MAG: cyclic nucleotide-binding domain-containing protein [Rhodospirillaceae bacterium]
MQDGEFFGEFSLLEKRKRVATIVSLTECQLLELKADDFERLLASHESMRDALDEVLDEVLKIRRKFYEGSTPSERV